jgi:hypothetical protein
MKNCGTANKTYTYKTYSTARIQLGAGMYSRQQLQDAIDQIDALNAQAKAAMQPKKEWVGLTSKDRKAIFSQCEDADRGYIAAMVEAKLKEKNT